LEKFWKVIIEIFWIIKKILIQLIKKKGMDVVKRIEAVKTKRRHAPIKNVIIADSGSISVDVPFIVPE
jgi:hypothetical protein